MDTDEESEKDLIQQKQTKVTKGNGFNAKAQWKDQFYRRERRERKGK